MNTTFTTINAVFTGKPENLETSLVFHIHDTSTRRILGHRLYVSWIHENISHEEALEESMSCVAMDRLGPVEVLRIG